MVFIELPIFVRCSAALFSDEDLTELQNMLLENPKAGDIISGSRGLRKLRVPLPGRGKRGGARVIYYYRSLSRKMSRFLSRILFEIHLLFYRFTRVQIDDFLGLPVAGCP